MSCYSTSSDAGSQARSRASADDRMRRPRSGTSQHGGDIGDLNRTLVFQGSSTALRVKTAHRQSVQSGHEATVSPVRAREELIAPEARKPDTHVTACAASPASGCRRRHGKPCGGRERNATQATNRHARLASERTLTKPKTTSKQQRSHTCASCTSASYQLQLSPSIPASAVCEHAIRTTRQRANNRNRRGGTEQTIPSTSSEHGESC